jgi:hypothetical protein
MKLKKKMNGSDIQVGIPRGEWEMKLKKKKKEETEYSEYFNAFFPSFFVSFLFGE